MTSTTTLITAAQPSEPTILRTDARGAVHRTPEQRERILDEYELSGLSGPKFAALWGVKYHTLAGWCTRRKTQRQAHPQRRARRKVPSGPQWLEASVQSATDTSLTG